MYTEAEAVLAAIKPDVVNALLGDEYIEDTTERTKKILPIIAEAVEDAAGEINGYIAKRYAVPLSPAPRVIVKYCKDIAIYNLYSRLGIDENDKEKNFLNRYRAAIKFLEYVAMGKINLGIEGENSNAGAAEKGFQMKSSGRIFSRNSMKGF